MPEKPTIDPTVRNVAPPAGPRVPTPEEKLSGDMLMFVTGLMVCAAALWLALYRTLGYQFSTAIPLVFQAASALTMALYLRYRKLQAFAFVQLSLILFTPFAMQWSIGNFVTSSGVSLWALIAPVGALTVLGTRESLPWFFGWLFMTAMAGVFDFMLGGVVQRVDLSTVAVFFVLNFTAISVMIYALLWYFANEKQKLRTLLENSFAEVHAEQARSEKLLLNILPPAIAARLKQGEVQIAQGHADVTVMFADIAGFTRMSEELSPVETVQILNEVFSIFDDLADVHGVEKIKTIGDAYMACAGLDPQGPVHYADAVADMALDMQARLAEYRQRSGQNVEIRIGIGTGPVVAGVIGRKKFIYDMWGDTVNIASRMAADSYTGGIEVDMTTYRRLQHRYHFDQPHEVEIKGKGRMSVFHLLSRMSGAPLRAADQAAD